MEMEKIGSTGGNPGTGAYMDYGIILEPDPDTDPEK
jgi:hypothetical protein